jgi:hypothetical protein
MMVEPQAEKTITASQCIDFLNHRKDFALKNIDATLLGLITQAQNRVYDIKCKTIKQSRIDQYFCK